MGLTLPLANELGAGFDLPIGLELGLRITFQFVGQLLQAFPRGEFQASIGLRLDSVSENWDHQVAAELREGGPGEQFLPQIPKFGRRQVGQFCHFGADFNDSMHDLGSQSNAKIACLYDGLSRTTSPVSTTLNALGYPELKRAVHEQFMAYHPTNILIEDKASGTQLIQELINERVYAVTGYEPKMDKIMRLHSVTSLIENGMVHLPENADWLNEYLHELTTFPRGKHDDQADSTSQALDWIKQRDLASHISVYTLLI